MLVQTSPEPLLHLLMSLSSRHVLHEGLRVHPLHGLIKLIRFRHKAADDLKHEIMKVGIESADAEYQGASG